MALSIDRGRMNIVPTAMTARKLPYAPNPPIGDLFGDISCAALQVEERVKGLFLGLVVGAAIGIVIGSKAR